LFNIDGIVDVSLLSKLFVNTPVNCSFVLVPHDIIGANGNNVVIDDELKELQGADEIVPVSYIVYDVYGVILNKYEVNTDKLENIIGVF